MRLQLTGPIYSWRESQEICMQVIEWKVGLCKCSGRADSQNGCPWLIWSISIPWSLLNTQCITNFYHSLCSCDGLRVYCVGKYQIISKVKARYWQKTHKFGIRIPNKVKESLEIDKVAGTNFGELSIHKEMNNLESSFEKVSHMVEYMRDCKIFPRYQQIRCHMIFDIKMYLNFNRKYCCVAGGHTTDMSESITYSSVVYRDSMQMEFMLAALNYLDVFDANINNAYLNAPCREKIWTKSGPEFGSQQGCGILILKALYGLNSSGASWRAVLAETLVK